ncbi:hypothetical protein QE435_004539 [Rhizobium sp. SORGH_AS 787]|nr:hypothetical protein [Rhizobium sp. SORGH_AS_0787]
MNEWVEKARGLSFGIATGFRAADGRFEEASRGHQWLMFEEDEDTAFWCPFNNQTATLEGRAFALNERAIVRATTYSLGASLVIHGSVAKWILARGRGIFVLNWRHAFDKLRDAPRISCDDTIVSLYRSHMRPERMPVMTVRRTRQAA